jgi:hypothetical protein
LAGPAQLDIIRNVKNGRLATGCHQGLIQRYRIGRLTDGKNLDQTLPFGRQKLSRNGYRAPAGCVAPIADPPPAKLANTNRAAIPLTTDTSPEFPGANPSWHSAGQS